MGKIDPAALYAPSGTTFNDKTAHHTPPHDQLMKTVATKEAAPLPPSIHGAPGGSHHSTTDPSALRRHDDVDEGDDCRESKDSPAAPATCCHISVRATIAVFCIALITLTAAITLLVTYSFSISAADRLAQDHAVALAAKAKNDVEGFMQRPVEAIAGMQYQFRRDVWLLPSHEADGMSITSFTPASSNDTNTPWFRKWWQRFVSQMAAASFAYQFAIFGFNDGNYAGCKLLSDSIFQCRVFSIATRNATGKSALYQENYDRSTYARTASSTGTTTYDPRTRSWWTAVPHLQDAMEWSSVYLSAMPTLPIVDINAAMYNASGTFLGITSFTFELQQLSSLMTSLKTTPNSVVVLLDNQLSLMATTKEASVPFMTQTTLPNVTTVPPSMIPEGCIGSDLSNGASSAMIVCRTNISSYPYRPLNELYRKYPSLFAPRTTFSTSTSTQLQQEVMVQLLSLSGERYYVTVASIETPRAPRGMGWRIVLLMPEMDVIGEIVSGRNTAIGIAAGLLVFFSVVAFVLISVVLSPLERLAVRMYLAATFDDDLDEEEEHKCGQGIAQYFTEVRTIEEAFGLLTGELTKVKSYLPQSVLAALYGDGEEDDDDDDDDEDRTSDDEESVHSAALRDGAAFGGAVAGAAAPAAPGLVMQQSIRSIPVAARRGSNQSIASSIARTGQPALNTMLRLQTKKVTILAANVASFHRLAQQSGSTAELLRIHGRIVELISAAAKETKGVVDGFHGDRFLITFNAVTTVGNHASAACTCALAIAKAFKLEANKGGVLRLLEDGVTCGIASSSALVGNMGSATLKRFCVIGSCVAQAAAAERISRLYLPRPLSAVLCGPAVHEVDNFFEVLFLDVVAFPSSIASLGVPTSVGPSTVTSRSAAVAQPTKVALLCGPKTVSCDEWMYQLQEGAAGSLYKPLNDAVEHLLWAPTTTAAQPKPTHHIDKENQTKQNALIVAHEEALHKFTLRPVGEGEDRVLHALSCVLAARLRKMVLQNRNAPCTAKVGGIDDGMVLLHANVANDVLRLLRGQATVPVAEDDVQPFQRTDSLLHLNDAAGTVVLSPNDQQTVATATHEHNRREGDNHVSDAQHDHHNVVVCPPYTNRLTDYFVMLSGGTTENSLSVQVKQRDG